MTNLRRWVRTGRWCPAGSELTRAASEGPGPGLQAHLERCAECAAEVDSLRQLSSELAALPEPPVDTEAFDQIAATLLGATNEGRAPASGGTPRPSRFGPRLAPWALSAAVGAVLIGGGFWLARSRPSARALPVAQAPATNGAGVRSFGDARFGRVQAPPDETVRLDEGTLQLDVPALGPTETFRVLTMDGEIRARAARFEMTATEGRLERVRVWSGRVEIHSSRFALTVLEAGDEWRGQRPEPARASGAAAADAPRSLAPTPRRAAAPIPARAIAVLGARPASAAPTARVATPEQIRFDRAWALLREARAAEAATAFEEVARRARGTSLEEDAAYWRAVALARAGDGPGARRELTGFIDRFPRSPHGGEANVALGWMLFESGQAASARTYFDRAARDPSARVRQSALEGLERTAP